MQSENHRSAEMYGKLVLTFLDSIKPISERLKNALLARFRLQRVPAMNFLLKKGEVCTALYFIISGTVRVFRSEKAAKSDKEVEVINWFLSEGAVVIAVSSYLEQTFSTEYIQALEDTTVISITKAALDQLYLDFPEFNYHRSVLLEKYYLAAAKQIEILNKRSALERYQLFLHHFPHLMTIWKDEYIAAFLGMETTYFSKVKVAFANRKH